ncbi:MAG: hypothetical protein ABIO72_02155 [Patescibacteria group bacterium]
MFGLTRDELRNLRTLSSPKKIQDYLDAIPYNFEPDGDTYLSPRRVMREKRAHCIEGAMLAALALRLQGERPLLLDLTSAEHDFDHVIALYKRYGCWGAVSKTNHAVLRYRDPVYRTLRELALSYFHEYTDDNGHKTLRSYSRPMDLARFDHIGWATSEEDLWDIALALDDVPHYQLVTRAQIAALRNADATERRAGEIVQWKKATASQ